MNTTRHKPPGPRLPPRATLPRRLAAFLAPAAVAALTAAAAHPAPRAPDFDSALALATTNNARRDIFVYLHGSDWCRLGEYIKTNVWDTAGLAAALADKTVLLDIDHPESVARRANDELVRRATALPPPQSAGDCRSAEGATFSRCADGSWLAGGAPSANDTYYLLSDVGNTPATVICLDALTDDSLPQRGPGRASNGNFCLTEITAALTNADGSATPVPLVAAWADHTERTFAAAYTIDGNTDKKNGWSPEGQRRHEDRHLLLVPHAPLPAGSRLLLTLRFASAWGQHTIGRVRARLAHDDALRTAVLERHAAEEAARRNARAGASTHCYPAVLCYDADGVLWGRIDGLRLDTTAQGLASSLSDMRTERDARERYWADAEQMTGPLRAERLGQGLDIVAELLGSPWGPNNRYKKLLDEIKKADPADVSGYARKFTFNAGACQGEALKLAEAGKYDEALAYLDKELEHPANRRLPVENLQKLRVARFRVFKSWPGHEPEQFAELSTLVAMAPETHTAIGARGYLMMHHRGPVTLTYGWAPVHCRPGPMTWMIDVDTARYFDHPGKYRVTAARAAGDAALVIHGMGFVANGREYGADRHDGRAGQPDEHNAYVLDLPEALLAGPFALRVTCETQGGTNTTGRFTVFPLLD